MKLNVPVLVLMLLLLPIPLPVPRPLPTWHLEKVGLNGVYLDELVKGFGVKHRMQPQESTGGRNCGDLGPPRHNVLAKYRWKMCERAEPTQSTLGVERLGDTVAWQELSHK